MEESFKRYSKGLSEYPKFKSKTKTRPSYRTNNITSTYKVKTYNSISIYLENKVTDFVKNPIILKNNYNYEKITEKILSN